VYSGARFPKEDYFLKGSLALPVCPSGKSSVKIEYERGALMEWCRRGKTEVLEEKSVAEPLCPSQKWHGLTWD
jgi:hypothetical protein